MDGEVMAADNHSHAKLRDRANLYAAEALKQAGITGEDSRGKRFLGSDIANLEIVIARAFVVGYGAGMEWEAGESHGRRRR
jgi:hypothetical protein